MPVSRLRRPLFLALLLYASSLGALRAAFPPRPPPWEGPEPGPGETAVLEAVLETAPRPGRRGASALALARPPGAAAGGGRVLLILPPGVPDLGRGSVVAAAGRLRRPRLPRGPGDFDERAYLARLEASRVLHARGLEPLGFRGSPGDRLLAAARRVRRSVDAQVTRDYPPPLRGPLRGVLLGDKTGLDPELARAMRAIGAYHLVVPSGSNVSFVLSLFALLAVPLRLGGWGRWALALSGAAFYGLMVGADPPYLRAFLCALLGALGGLLDRECDLFQALTLSALLLLLWEPGLLFDRGFQMSYLVVAALAVSEPHDWAPGGWPRPARWAAGVLAAGVVAQLSLVPVLSELGGVLSPAGIAANLALVPLSGLLMASGYAAWALSPLPLVPEAAAAGAAVLSAAFRWVCLSCASLTAGSLRLLPFSGPETAAYYSALLGLLLRGGPRASRTLLLLGGLLLAGESLSRRLRAPELSVVVLDLPPPGAALIFPGSGGPLLVYGRGAPGTVRRAVSALGLRRPERLVLLRGPWERPASLEKLRLDPGAKEVVDWRGPRPYEYCRGKACLRFAPRGPLLLREGEEALDLSAGRWKLL